MLILSRKISNIGEWMFRIIFFWIALEIALFNGVSFANPLTYGFEPHELAQPSSGTSNLACSGNCPVTSDDVARLGSKSLKSVVDRLNSATMYRTEVSHKVNMDVNNGTSTTDYWLGFSVYLPGPYPVMTMPVYEIIFQLHAMPPDGNWSNYVGLNPNLALFLVPKSRESGQFKFWVRGTDEPYPQEKSQVQFHQEIHEYQTDHWYDFVIHTRLDSTSAGFTKVWINGKLVVDHSGATYYRGHGNSYPKLGFYNGWRTRDLPGEAVRVRMIYHDEYRYAFGAAGGYEKVSPTALRGGTEGLAPPDGLRVIVLE
jgi:hypothetical protein